MSDTIETSNTADLQEQLGVLLKKAQTGDKSAYESFLSLLYPFLENFLWKRISSKKEVPDIVQDIVISIHRVRHTYNPEKPIYPWLFAIVKYKTIDFFRRHNRMVSRHAFGDDALDMVNANTTDERDIDNRWLVENYLKKLNDKQRALIKQVKLEGLSIKEAASQFDMTESNVKTSIHRIIAKLKKFAKEEDSNA